MFKAVLFELGHCNTRNFFSLLIHKVESYKCCFVKIPFLTSTLYFAYYFTRRFITDSQVIVSSDYKFLWQSVSNAVLQFIEKF
jgi:hypothetical protein